MAVKSWSVLSSAVDTDTTLFQVPIEMRTVLIAISIANYGSSTATASLRITDSSDVTLSYILSSVELISGDTIHVDTKIALNAEEKLVFLSDNTEVSVLVTGDES